MMGPPTCIAYGWLTVFASFFAPCRIFNAVLPLALPLSPSSSWDSPLPRHPPPGTSLWCRGVDILSVLRYVLALYFVFVFYRALDQHSPSLLRSVRYLSFIAFRLSLFCFANFRSRVLEGRGMKRGHTTLRCSVLYLRVEIRRPTISTAEALAIMYVPILTVSGAAAGWTVSTCAMRVGVYCVSLLRSGLGRRTGRRR